MGLGSPMRSEPQFFLANSAISGSSNILPYFFRAFRLRLASAASLVQSSDYSCEKQEGPVSHPCRVSVEFCLPPADLARYFTTFYVARITVASGGSSENPQDCSVSDYLHPEWGNLRLFSNHAVAAEAGPGSIVADTNFI